MKRTFFSYYFPDIFIKMLTTIGKSFLLFLFAADFCIIAVMKATPIQRHLQQGTRT